MARNFPVEILVRFIFVWIGVAAVYGQSPSYCQYNGYNINPLQNTSSDYVINSGLYIYYINVCGPVLAKQCLPTQAVTCQTWNGGKATLSVYNTGTAGPLSRSSGSEGFTVQFFLEEMRVDLWKSISFAALALELDLLHFKEKTLKITISLLGILNMFVQVVDLVD